MSDSETLRAAAKIVGNTPDARQSTWHELISIAQAIEDAERAAERDRTLADVARLTYINASHGLHLDDSVTPVWIAVARAVRGAIEAEQ